MKKIIGLRSEILISLSVLVVSGLLFAALFLLKVAENELVQERIEFTLGLLHRLPSVAATQTDRARFLHEIDWLFRQMSNAADLQAYSLLDAEQRRFSGSNAIRADSETLQNVIRSGTSRVAIYSAAGWRSLVPGSAGGSFECYLPLIFEGSVEGVLLTRFSLDGVAQRMALAQQAVVVLIFGFGAVLVGFGTYLLGRTVVSPVRRLMQATAQVAGGELGVSLPVDGPREIAQLAVSFNAMTQALQDSRSETQATIASLHRTNAELAEARDNLVRSEKMAAVGNLAAGMAHEIGNPLGASLGYLEFLQTECHEPQHLDLLTRTTRELARIDRLVRDLLDFAAPDTEADQVFESADAAREALDLLCHQGVFSEIDLRVELPEALAMVRGSRHKLVQVLVNLLLNARDSCVAGQGRVIVQGFVDVQTVCFVIRDNGCGFSPALQERIFEPFFTTKEPGKGRGLGLFFCHKVVEQWQGRLEVDSRIGQGTCFTLSLPAFDAEAHHA
ncbi:His Kinase A (phospho-acceptor) domain-containing protein [Geoalkalibacter ferrihydriticus]|uniref:histidine kinase n=1 Tax=Geoalkalibacter ferrihydriticus TaxID=392333 RepID=A0A1G9K2L5_9BACT|nr:ATP-binding protein [Geoalkalibacter ferrihydriticus]SDL43988.1 His Kinase A (phospho-acceptor) domain-containing protein [Geoalkalibacter ferrihydriticus]